MLSRSPSVKLGELELDYSNPEERKMFIDSIAFRDIVTDLVMEVRGNIRSYCRASDSDTTPGIQLTVACDEEGDAWAYQTGDNSYWGPCYHLQHWAVANVYSDTIAVDAAAEIIDQLTDAIDEAVELVAYK